MNLTGQSFGRYHILEQLGEGGMATVFKAYDTRLDTNVAVKVIRRSAFAPDQLDQMLKRFEREAKSLAKLSHANIVGIIDYGEHEGIPYLVMEYLPGGTLKDKLGHPMPHREAARILLPIARALDFAHRKGMAHRDVKPSNILITDDGDPMLTDFGIAKMLEGQEGMTLTGTGVGIGTPEYMAPEQWTGQAGPSSDIYSLGVVFFEMLTGRKPYVADTPAAVLLKQASDPLPSPRDFVADLPSQVENILFRALAKKPEDRFATMGDFAASLESLQAEPTLLPSQPAATAAVISQKTPLQSEASKATNLETIAVGDAKVPAPETVIAVQAAGQPPSTDKASGKSKSRWWVWAVVGVIIIGLIAVGVMNVFQPKASSPVSEPTLAPEIIVKEKDTPTSPEPVVIPPTAPPEDCISPEVLCVGLVTHVGTIDDKSFNQSAWEAITLAEAKLGVRADFIESTDTKDYGKNISNFADEGYDVIVTVGFALSDATTAAAAMYPEVDFIGVDQFQTEILPNVTGLNFPEDQAGFLVGALAAMMSKTGKIGAVCGTDAIPPVWRFGEGYKAGAAFVDPAVNVNVVYHNDVGFDKTFTDPEWGAVTANSMIDKSVDVIFGCGGKTGNGAVTAAAQAGKYAIGVDTDQYYSLPEAAPRMLSSALKMITPGVFALIELSQNGNFPGGNYLGTSGYAPYHDLDAEVPDETRAMMEKINALFLEGSLQTNVPPAKP